MDDESWYSVTPEIIAQHIARRCFRALSRWEGGVSGGVGKEGVGDGTGDEGVTKGIDKESVCRGNDNDGVSKAVGDLGKMNGVLPQDKQEGKHTNTDGLVVWDLFSGCGGNAIPLALTFPRVVAVDIDKEKIPNLLHNAAIYGNSHPLTSLVPLLNNITFHNLQLILSLTLAYLTLLYHSIIQSISHLSSHSLSSPVSHIPSHPLPSVS